MLLAIDVGNTNVTIGVFEGERLVHNWRLAALRERTADELGIFVTRLFEQTNVAAASVSGIAVAALEKYGQGRGVPLIVVDFGTATTFDVISREGEYAGGVICPGIGISAEALFQRAARLPRVEVRKPEGVVGQTTVHAMQSGLFFGYVELVDGLVRRIRAEIASGEKAIVIATGGLAPVLADETAAIQHVDGNLTLDGLR